ncbi:HlyD family type I secretion periplasmic adaptor subunit [Neorhizobium sp. NPDC001467]|uniref:HlyD family type I secretion periplasmic adaptor subunit n=1 Tax=Neorhizobium sp. NPDC001467 TaxID=3390595 RepID=UPI003D0106C8
MKSMFGLFDRLDIFNRLKLEPGVATPASKAIRRYLLASVVTVGVLVIGAGGWAATANLSSAVIGSGTIVVEGSTKRIQHREGGIIGQIRVTDGSRVRPGELLIRLDDTITRANLAVVAKQIDQLEARRMRLIAERDEQDALKLPQELADRRFTPAVADYISAETALFKARRETMQAQKGRLGQQIGQIEQERRGLEVRRDAKNEELSWVAEELRRISNLSEQGLVQFTRLSQLQRTKAQLDGERGQLIAEIARAATRISETELQILQLDQDRRAEVLTEMRDIDNKLAELAEQRIAAEDQLKRIEITAPQAGIVHELAVHTIGGVIAPGDTVMLIVPTDDKLVIDTKIRPADIDQVRHGQRAALRFSAFNQRTTPEIDGIVETVSADLNHNPQTGESWYSARITIPPQERIKLGDLTLVAGMPVETFVQSGERSALSYLVKPLTDQVARAMREN